MSGTITRLTSGGIKKLATELIDLYESRNNPHAVVAELASEEMCFYDTRIKELEKLLYSAEQLSEMTGEEAISLGSNVTLFDPHLDVTETYKLVHPVESSPTLNYLSVESILGKKLLHKKTGDEVCLSLYGDTIRYNILDVN
ncbi:GreA/GreB family elongation factor [Pseudalkalibacillus sp. SCS-8]|uniref:GreA/GreB family elongation factor n=1 Tax=Pseudalkalibacillus nanhaiensis TaxID=3115291 RepID=UPI0032DB7332